MKKLNENLYYVGTQNPSLRTFDIIVPTEYGTTYNSYLVKGEKTALIETTHNKFWDIFKKDVEEIMPLENIDYVIFNHTEPDHSGALEKLLEINPKIKAVGSMAAIKFLKQITNKEFDSITVKDGDKLDLGNGIELSFISAPNLHWADSMFTYCKAMKTVFTCDFLGCHYCEPTITDEFLTVPDGYWRAFEVYYNCIMGPFKKFVTAGIEKLNKLDFDTVCPSHGPILRENISKCMEKYSEWAKPVVIKNTISVFYVSAYGYTEMMAKALAKGAADAGCTVEIFDIAATDLSVISQKLATSSAYMFGSPTINKDAVKPVWDVLSMVDPISNRGKNAFLFGSYGWSGEAVANLKARCEGIGLRVSAEPIKICFKPNDTDISSLYESGKAFAELIKA